MAMITWTIWNHQNHIRTRQKDYPLSQVVPQHHKHWLISKGQILPHTCGLWLPHLLKFDIWHPPPTGVYKINFDEAVFKDIGKAGVGVVVRNSDGQALASLSEQKSLQFSSNIVEAQAATWAITFTQELGAYLFILEGDSKKVIKELNADEESFSPYGQILASAKASLGARTCISFSHVCSLDNSVTHNLAKHVRSFQCKWRMFLHTYSLFSLPIQADFILMKKCSLSSKKKMIQIQSCFFIDRSRFGGRVLCFQLIPLLSNLNNNTYLKACLSLPFCVKGDEMIQALFSTRSWTAFVTFFLFGKIFIRIL